MPPLNPRDYRMPAEWEPHAATWLTWPRRDGISFPDAYEEIPALWAHMARLISEGETVHINCFSEDVRAEATAALRVEGIEVSADDSRVVLHDFPAYEPWCRDHGPLFVRNESGGLAIVNWGYNAWGDKYPPYDLDNQIPERVSEYLEVPIIEPSMILEGGSIDVDGQGTLLTTEACLLNPNRNPRLTRTEIEARLGEYLGVRKVLWLGDGIVGDDTDGHIDDLTRFVAPGRVVTIVEDDPSDANYAALGENRARLSAMTDACDQPLQVIDLPTPGVVSHDGERLPASYANFYIANAVVLLPSFAHPNDEKAQAILQEQFPDRRVVAVDSRALVWGLGSFHCVTQQQPAARS